MTETSEKLPTGSKRFRDFLKSGLSQLFRANPDHPDRARFDFGLVIVGGLIGAWLYEKVQIDFAKPEKIHVQSPTLMQMDQSAIKTMLKALKTDPAILKARRDWRRMSPHSRLWAMQHVQQIFMQHYPGVPAFPVTFDPHESPGAAGWVNNAMYPLAQGRAPDNDFSRVFISKNYLGAGRPSLFHSLSGYDKAASIIIHECCHVVQMSMAARLLLNEWQAASPAGQRDLIAHHVKDHADPADWQAAEKLYLDTLNKAAGQFVIPSDAHDDADKMRIEFEARTKRPTYRLRVTEQHAFKTADMLFALHRLPPNVIEQLGDDGLDRVIAKLYSSYRPGGLIHSLPRHMPQAVKAARRPSA